MSRPFQAATTRAEPSAASASTGFSVLFRPFTIEQIGDRGRPSATELCSYPGRRTSTLERPQLYGEFKVLLPGQRGWKLSSTYYDFTSRKAYVPRSRHLHREEFLHQLSRSTRMPPHGPTAARLLERDGRHTSVRLRVGAFYGIVSVETLTRHVLLREGGEEVEQRQLIADLVALQYKRIQSDFTPRIFVRSGATSRALFPGPPGRPRLAHRALRRRGRDHPGIRSAHRPQDRRPRGGEDLRQLPLRHPAPHAAAGDQGHQGRAEEPPRRAQPHGPPARGAAARAAHAVRLGDDRGHRRLQRHRELLALPHRPPPRRAAADLVRVPARQRHRLRRREPRHHPADRRHVSRRLPPQGDAGRVRLPPAVLHGQPADALRGVGRHAPAIGARLRYARRVGDGAQPAASSSSR